MAGFYQNTAGNIGQAGTYNQNANTGLMRNYDPTELSGAQMTEAQRAQMPAQLALQQGALGNEQQKTANQAARFSSIFGLLGGQLNNGGGMARAAADLNPMANISTGPVLNDQQIQQQVNQSTAATNQGVQGQQQRTSASLAGRGFGSNSPLAMALNQATANQGLATNVGNETNTRLNASQMNAQHMLGAQQAQAGNVNQYNQNLIENAKPYWQRQNALISALGGLV